MNNEVSSHFTASIRGIEVSVKHGWVEVRVNGVAQLDDDDVRAVSNALDTANIIVSLGG
ncbi:hypothetical protein TH728_02805 [Corynebacterium amycolatum]|uniref:hypothetical protein n=1 Tax=Corynebacterium amycolatum TaxID=43765 RepID=UPI002AAC5112|nr:hypothetical protein [Corynebacterium amycolatum]MDY7341357.1 hypothetical protein [Corynebacterium amycolatum]